MRALVLLLAAMLMYASGEVRTGSPAAAKEDQASIGHLPEATQKDVTAWRQALLDAKCLKVVCDTDETWANLYELDSAGSPRVVLHERYSVHSWMTPTSSWVVVFPFDGEVVNTKKTVYQHYWDAASKKVWERVWAAKTGSYQVRQYDCPDPKGPTEFDFGETGCICATAMVSWLSGPHDLSERLSNSIGLMRRPNLAMVPPDPSRPGLWLDVFSDAWVRNEVADGAQLYRRRDFMLLSRNQDGSPQVTEWRTIAVSDPTAGGKRPQQTTGIRRLSYTFFDTEPAELRAAVSTFVKEASAAAGK